MAYNNVIELKSYSAQTDHSLNRSAIFTEDVPDGSVFILDTAPDDTCWDATVPSATSHGVWMVTSPYVIRPDMTQGHDIDPRRFMNKAGIPMDMTMLTPYDMVGMTGHNIENIATRNYLTVGNSHQLVAAVAPPTDGSTYFRKIRTEVFNIGSPDIIPMDEPLYVYEVVQN